MANGIKIGNLDISAFKVGSDDCKVYLGDTLLYPTTPPTPTFDGKWLATYTGGTTSSAECDASSAITSGEITLTDLESLKIGNCVTNIGSSMCSGCTSLTSCTIGNSVTSIGNYAFRNCRSLTSIDIPSGVTSINQNSFRDCSSLTSIDIPSGVTSIGSNTFNGCSGLTSVTLNAVAPPTLGSQAFYRTTCPIYVPAGSVEAYKAASGWSTYASRIQAIPNS